MERTIAEERQTTALPREGPSRAPEPPPRESLPHVVIQPSRGWVRLNLSDLWLYRELLYFLVWRDVKVRYKQTAVGALWAILQPLLLALLFTLIFSRVGKLQPPGGVPYVAFAYAGLLPWLLFVTALTDSSQSLVKDKDLITKVYFPRLAVPLATILAAIVDFFVA